MILTHRIKKAISILLLLIVASGLIPAFSLTPSALSDPENEHCESSLVYCIEANQILYEKKIDDVHFPTGLTKLMTAVIASRYAVEKLPDGYDTICTVSATAYHSTTGADISLRINEKISFYNLLVGMILGGANDCANVLAERVGGSIDGFVMMMNDKAQELGMTETFFANPTGMHDPLMVTTARDMLTLAKYAMTDTTITEIASQKTVTIPATNRSEKRVIGTRNYLVSERATTAYYLNTSTGLISGNTPEGGYCVIGTASHNGSNFIAIVMKASAPVIVDQERVLEIDEEGNFVIDEEGNFVELQPRITHTVFNCFLDARSLLRWADSSFRFVKIIDKSTPICEIGVKLAKNTDRVAVIPETPVELYVPSDLDRNRDLVIDWTLDSNNISAPVYAGTRVGSVKVFYKGEFVDEVPLVVNTTIEQNSILVLLNAAWEMCKTPVVRVILLLILVGSVAYVIITAIDREKRKKAKRRRELGDSGRKYLT